MSCVLIACGCQVLPTTLCIARFWTLERSWLQVMFTGDHLGFRAARPMEATPFSSEDDKLSVFECATAFF